MMRRTILACLAALAATAALAAAPASGPYDKLKVSAIGEVLYERNRPLATYCRRLHEKSGARFLLHPDVLADTRTVHLYQTSPVMYRSRDYLNIYSLKHLVKQAGFQVAEVGDAIAIGPAAALEGLEAGKETWPEVDWDDVERNAELAAWLSARLGARDTEGFETLGDLLDSLGATVMRGYTKPLFAAPPSVRAIPLQEMAGIPDGSTPNQVLDELLPKLGLKHRAKGGLLEIAPEISPPGQGFTWEEDPAAALKLAMERRVPLVAVARVPVLHDVAASILRGSEASYDSLRPLGPVLTSLRPGKEKPVTLTLGKLENGTLVTEERTGTPTELVGIANPKGIEGPVLVIFCPAAGQSVGIAGANATPAQIAALAAKAARANELIRKAGAP